MKRYIFSPVIAIAILFAPLFLSSCGDDATSAPQAGGVQIDPEVRKSAMAKLQEKGIELSPVALPSS